MSLFGEVVVKRKGYAEPGVSSLFPLDAQLNLPPEKYSHGLRQRVSQEVARGSFDAAVASVERTTGAQVPKRQAEELAVEVSQDFVAFYETRQSQGVESTPDPLVMSADGKGIVMRKEGLREGTRKAAERAKDKPRARLGPGEKKNRKRMARVAALYGVAPHVRSAEAIMGVEQAPGTEEAEAWGYERALQVLKGHASQVRRSATLRGLAPSERAAVDDCADYLLKYKDMLRYDEYLAQGLPITTGVIEGACRHLVNDRMDITGARWGLLRAEAVLKLRSLSSSADADEY